MKIAQINKESCRYIISQVQHALDKIEIDGIELKIGNATYNQHNLRFKIEANLIQNGQVITKDAQNWVKHAQFFGLPVEALGKKINLTGNQYKIVGLRPRSRNSVILERISDQKRFKYPADYIKAALWYYNS